MSQPAIGDVDELIASVSEEWLAAIRNQTRMNIVEQERENAAAAMRVCPDEHVADDQT